MDPYLERFWRSVHHTLVTYAAEALQPQLPADLVARVEERVFVADEDRLLGVRYPDVKVREPHGGTAADGGAPASAAVAEPVILEFVAEPVTEGYLEIRDAADQGRVVTSIEFLSPTNKVRGAGAREYVQKQRLLWQAGVNLVEIDFTREGDRELALPLERAPAELNSTYMACVRRAAEPQRLAVYPLPLSERLPAIAIPLRSQDVDARLDLQSLVDRIYDLGRYDRDIDYTRPPQPPLNAPDAQWAAQFLTPAS
jgi:hypothetical protein